MWRWSKYENTKRRSNGIADEKNRKTFHSLLKILVVVTILNIMIPSQGTFYKMIATSYVTPANIEIIGDNVDKIADKIVDKINKVKQ